MGELKTRPTNASVAAFIAALPDAGTRKDCKAIVAMMRKASGKKPEMWGASIIGFGRMLFRGKSGETEWPEIALSPRKAALTLYLMFGLDGNLALLNALGRHKRGRSCLYIKRLSDVDVPTLNKLIGESVRNARAYQMGPA